MLQKLIGFAICFYGISACLIAQEMRVAVLSSAETPSKNTSQGLYINILEKAGWKAGAISAESVQRGGLDSVNVFVIGGGSGTKFNSLLGETGGRMVEEFVKNGGGVLASCAGGYSFVRGHNEALKFIEIANAECIDTRDGRWARGKGVVQIKPHDSRYENHQVYYANGPLWKITDAPGFGRTVSLASFVTDIKKDGDSGGVMPGTPAILAGTFGKGRFVLFSPHPEFHAHLKNHSLITDAARWVTQGEMSEEETINWPQVFPSSKSRED